MGTVIYLCAFRRIDGCRKIGGVKIPATQVSGTFQTKAGKNRRPKLAAVCELHADMLLGEQIPCN